MSGFSPSPMNPALLRASSQKIDLPSVPNGDRQAIKKAAQEFEAMFVAQMLKPVFDTLPQGGPFSGGPGEKIFQGLLVEQYGKAVAASSGVGIAQVVEQEMLARQNEGGGNE
ncbi:hypothetical protein CKO28_16075 [Rhodovibrio sodomensis]|uniref:Flagellar protein FlgJ N-terminal domain-containing protein n=1 Tax=Rhodovibrio sodomensis TaxID=1088 RepID=A0ABS1DHH7_9PROT|nr:rod-binding protein [Rhodovibrio sodomensis]MBK1669557.1 hypothetical protein [Rhodovibrio sodomensis]